MWKDENILETRQLTRRFGGLVAVGQLDLTVRHGELLALIGPNGAGKTTLFNLICGRLSPTEGEIFFKGRNITGLRPDRISHLGIARTLQITSIFQGLTVFDNVWVAAQSRMRFFNPLVKTARFRDLHASVTGTLEKLGLADKGGILASELSYGDQRLLEIAIALATRPSLLLLDEPTSGLSGVEAETVTQTVAELVRSVDVILVEHDMGVVMNLADRVVVLHEGRIIADGSPDQISKNELVQEVYLGG
ncbi:MAG: ABC transporter ATP-binding protein [Candidatus Rokubacteria bacterium]|nr:ABC transporter ATP-binding protein [Candidatus Rokubacteria bacterium]